MSEQPSPRAARLAAPRWLDTRFVAGVALVLTSVVAGAAVVAGADDTVGVYALTRDVAAGQVLTAQDTTVVQVDLPEVGRYVRSGSRAPDGQVLGRSGGQGELLALGALLDPGALEARRLVSLPVDRLHVSPGLAAGDLVDVYATTGAAESPSASRVVLQRARVVDAAQDDGALAGGTGLRAVVVEVDPPDVGPLVLALQGGRLDLVVVVPGRGLGEVAGAAVAAGNEPLTADLPADDLPADDVSADDLPADDVSADDVPAGDVPAGEGSPSAASP